MKEEVDVFGFKFPKEAIFREDGTMTVLGVLLIFCIAESFLRWCGEHPDKLKEIFNEKARAHSARLRF